MISDLSKQRRNLLIISCALIIFDFAQATIAKVSLLGTELLIGKPEVLIIAAWVLWAYSFLRYYQYLREESSLDIVGTFSRHFRYLAKIKHIDPLSVQAGTEESFESSDLVRTGIASYYFERYGYDPTEGAVTKQSSEPVSAFYVMLWFIRSTLHVTLNTPRITDHVIPIIIAVLAPVVSYIY